MNVLLLKSSLAGISPHLSEMLDGTLATLSEKTNPMRYSLAAHGLRELLRELLAHYAPDSMIKVAQWYKPDSTSKTGITRKHRTTFAVYGYVNPSILPNVLSKNVDDIARDIVGHYDRLSNFAHTTTEVLKIPEEEAIILVESTLELFPRLLSSIIEGKKLLNNELETALMMALNNLFISDFLGELDMLSTHTRPTGAEDIAFLIKCIDKKYVYFDGTGSVSCDLQYGSDGDCSRGDGVEWEDSFPFSFEGRANVMDLKLTVTKENISIDTSKFHGEKEFDPHYD